jgi:fructokinase
MLIGIDWGGTKIEAIALSREGATLARERVATPQGDYEACLQAAAGLVIGIEARLGATGSVGLGIPGAISPATGLVKNANSTWLNGRPLQADVERALARPVRIENDANCLAVSEAADGAGAGARVVWAIIVGTGAGSGIAVDGRALSGRHRIAGEWGHTPLPRPDADEWPGLPCWCGRRGCLELYVSGTGFAADHARATGRTWRAEEIVDAMRSGDEGAAAAYRRLADRLARGLAQGVNLLDPDAIVLGGGLSDVDEFVHDLPDLIAPHVFSDAFTTPVRRSMHGASSGVRGAAWLWR